ncbi:hypothetical protein [Solibacillus sp. FSL H8-0538]|uniref:hypothetical protein n=1 Tax=Solibacillus sp. FSL H8-0538 TaxID=2921400 RepID=UPI0030F8AF22
MIRLIKKINNETLYWQVWKVGEPVFIQSGTLGVSGEKEELKLNSSDSSTKIIRSLAEEKLMQGYELVGEKALIQIVVQYRYGDKEQFAEIEEKCLFVEVLLDHALFNTGNGEVIGFEIGDGGGTHHLYVVDVKVAFETILKELSTHNLLEGVEIAFLKENGGYSSLYPKGVDFEPL